MKVIERQNSYFTKQAVDRLNDLARCAIQKVQSIPIVDLYTEHPIFRINSKNLLVQYKEFDEGANLVHEARYAYDALGRRIEKVVTDLKIPLNNKTRRYVYDGEDILKVFDENNQVISKYTHSSLRIDDALAIDDKVNNKSYYFLKDHLGSVIDIVNDDLSFKQHYAYSGFGELQKVTDIGGNDVTTNPALEHHFTDTGREYDQESGLYLYRARAYDASIGRFLQVDPHPGVFGNSVSVINKYTYVLNNPNAFIDSSGEFVITAIIVGAIVGVVLNEVFDLGFSGFEAALIGAFAGYAAAGVVAGIPSLGAASISTQALTAASYGLAVGAGAGLAASLSVTFANAAIENSILHRINLISRPLAYMNYYPAESVGGILWIASRFCKSGELKNSGGSCDL